MSSPITRLVTQQVSKLSSSKVAIEAAQQVSEAAAKSVLDPAIAKRAKQLSQTNAAVVMPSAPERLMAVLRSGTLQGADTKLALRNVTQSVQENGGFAAFLLSDKGKMALATDAALDDLLVKASKGVPGKKKAESAGFLQGLRFGVQGPLSVPLTLQDDVQHVLIDAKHYSTFLEAYSAAVAKGEAPASFAGKPFTEFFRATDDLYNDLEVEAFKRVLPGFAQKPIEEQKAVAALASRVSADFPAGVSEETRRKVAAAMVTHKDVSTVLPSGQTALEELKQFYHGTRAAELIAENGFKVGDGARYGRGIYFSNPTASSGYTYKRPSEPAQLVSGKVDVGNVTSLPFSKAKDADTRMVPRTKLDFSDTGDYWVTKDPKRFTIKAITTYDPAAKNALDAVIPDLIEAYPQNAAWSSRLLERIDPERRIRALEHALKTAEGEVQQAAGILLAREGNHLGVPAAIKALGSENAELRRAAADALLEVTKKLGPERVEEATPLITALMSAPGVKPSQMGRQLLDNLGEGAMPALREAGYQEAPLGKLVNWFKKTFSA